MLKEFRLLALPRNANGRQNDPEWEGHVVVDMRKVVSVAEDPSGETYLGVPGTYRGFQVDGKFDEVLAMWREALG